MAGWHHRLDGHEFEWTLGVGDGQGGLECCGSWGHKESDTTEWLNWTEEVSECQWEKNSCIMVYPWQWSTGESASKNTLDLWEQVWKTAMKYVRRKTIFVDYAKQSSTTCPLYICMCSCACVQVCMCVVWLHLFWPIQKRRTIEEHQEQLTLESAFGKGECGKRSHFSIYTSVLPE